MRIRYGYRIELVCAHDMPLITLLDVHPSRRHDLTTPDEMKLTALADPSRPIAMTQDLDAFGNIRRRMVAPAGGVRLESEGIVHDSGEPDIVNLTAREVSPSRLPDSALVLKPVGDSLVAPALLIGLCVLLGLYAVPLVEAANIAVQRLADPNLYIQGVLGGS